MPLMKSNFSPKILPKEKTKTAKKIEDNKVIKRFIKILEPINSVLVNPSIVFCLNVPNEYSLVILLMMIIAKKQELRLLLFFSIECQRYKEKAVKGFVSQQHRVRP